MRILTVDNLAYDLNKLPETVSDDMAFSVLDNSNPKEPDFFFIPLIYIFFFKTLYKSKLKPIFLPSIEISVTIISPTFNF